MSMRERMLTANDVLQLDLLILETLSTEYRFAPERTRRRWRRAAAKRRKELAA